MNKMLISVGEGLYGPRWQTDLARDLNVADRTMRRWTAGDDVIPDGVRKEIIALIDKRIERLQFSRERLKRGG